MVFNNQSAVIPERLETEEFLIRPLTGNDVHLDYVAVMESREFLRRWEQASWPTDDFTLADNLKDLERHEQEHIDRVSFTFTVMNPTNTECLGCIYIFPLTVKWMTRGEPMPVGDSDWADYEAVISFWIRQSRMSEGMDSRLLDVLRPWFDQKWAFDGLLYFTNDAVPQQVALFEDAQLQLRFKIEFAKQEATSLAYA